MKYGAFVHDKVYIFNNKADAEEFILACVEESSYNVFCTGINVRGNIFWNTVKNQYAKGYRSKTFENYLFNCSVNHNDCYIVEVQEVNWDED